MGLASTLLSMSEQSQALSLFGHCLKGHGGSGPGLVCAVFTVRGASDWLLLVHVFSETVLFRFKRQELRPSS